MRYSLECWKKAIDELSLDMDLTLPIKSIGLNYSSMERLFETEMGADFPFRLAWDAVKRHFADYRDNIGIPVKKGFDTLCRGLKQKGIGMYVATSTYHDSAIAVLSKCGIWQYFDGIVGGDEIQNGKPHPEIFLKAASLANCLPHECIVAEDSENGVKSALAAKIPCIFIKDLKDIPTELKGGLLAECEDLSGVLEYI